MKKSKGFTLMEMLIVVAVIAILIIIAIPVFTAQLDKTREATCSANRRSLQSVALTAFMTGKDDGTNYADTRAAFDAVFTNDAYGKEHYICPSKGTLSWIVDDEQTGHVLCEKHGGLHGASAAEALAKQIQHGESTISQYLNKVLSTNRSLDYPNPGGTGFAGWSQEVIKLAKEAGIDLEGGSWRIYKWGKNNISVYYYDGDISKMAAGDSLDNLTKWSIVNGSISKKEGSAAGAVVANTVAGKTYNIINNVRDDDLK